MKVYCKKQRGQVQMYLPETSTTIELSKKTAKKVLRLFDKVKYTGFIKQKKFNPVLTPVQARQLVANLFNQKGA